MTPLGFAAKAYAGPARWWLNNVAASIIYELFFMLLVFLIIPRKKAITPIAVGVCAATIALEFLQLWQPPWLTAIRGTFPGRALLGTTFVWSDLPIYPLGCLLGWLLLHALVRRRATA
ncbi:MAG: DUF2809 domain-containing protein [Planctomycetota bacterium]|nr:DUF2809 domain-containing protein [Planctomycetota bacterium]